MALVLGASAATGFIALAYEILWYRVFSFVNASSPLTFGLLLGMYLAGLAVGALVARAFCAPVGDSSNERSRFDGVSSSEERQRDSSGGAADGPLGHGTDARRVATGARANTHAPASPVLRRYRGSTEAEMLPDAISRTVTSDADAHARGRAIAALAIFVLFAQVAGFAVIPAVAWTAVHAHWALALGAVLLAATLLGASLPLLAHFGIAPDDRAGARLSYVYLANIVGSAAGSLVVGFVLLDAFPTATVALGLVLAGLALVVALLVLGRVKGVPALVGYAGALVAAAACVWATPTLFDRLYERLQFKDKLAADFRFWRVVENRSGVITVAPSGEVYGGGAYDGIFNASIVYDRNGIFRSYALGAMRPHYQEALMIGLASGSWAQVVVNLPDVKSLTIVEINPGYQDILRERPEVSWLLDDPRVHIVIDDGRRWLLRHPEKRFDLLVMNTTWHWRAHATNLLSKDFFELAKSHLEPGAVFFFNTTHSEDVLATAARSFPYALRVYNFVAVSDQPLAMDRTRWHDLLTTMRVHGEPVIDLTKEYHRERLAELEAYVDTVNQEPDAEGLESRESMLVRFRDAKTVTDDNMVPEWRDSLGAQLHR
jgi:predicted membrane-bound spermidine synthase